MIWLKRIAPLLLAAAIYFGYRYGSDYLQKRADNRETEMALVTAQVWTATARFRDDSERFISFRDSLLKAENVTTKKLFKYLKRFEEEPELSLAFTNKVHLFVDSLSAIEDSLLKDAADSALTIDTLEF